MFCEWTSRGAGIFPNFNALGREANVLCDRSRRIATWASARPFNSEETYTRHKTFAPTTESRSTTLLPLRDQPTRAEPQHEDQNKPHGQQPHMRRWIQKMIPKPVPLCHARCDQLHQRGTDRKSTRLNSSHLVISYAVFCLKKKKNKQNRPFISILKKLLHNQITKSSQ